MAKVKKKKRLVGNKTDYRATDYGATDYGAGDLRPVGLDGDGNPLCKRDTPNNDKMVLRLIDQKSGHARHAVNLTPSPIDTLFQAGLINQTLKDAGDRLAEDYHRAGLHPQLGMNYSVSGGSGGSGGKGGAGGPGGDGEIDEAARRRWISAVRAMGPGYGDAVCAVVFHEDRGAVASNFGRLKVGLQRLVKHYGMWMGDVS